MHVISGLNAGGAELMLLRLVKSRGANSGARHVVVSLTGIGKVGLQLQAAGITVYALKMHSAVCVFSAIFELVQLIRALRPEIVQTWMYHADLIGGVAARLAGNSGVIWGVRGAAIPQPGMSTTKFVVNVCSLLSRFIPRVIVCCAESARVAHAKLGYDSSKLVVIPNGYELSCLVAHPSLRQQTRASFGISDEDIVIGIVGRFDPLKDHFNFVCAALLVAARVPAARFLMVGRGLDPSNSDLQSWLSASEFPKKFVLAGEQSDVLACYAAMDIFCLSSTNEGFPNVVCEAMAMNIPCVVTDAGDAAEIVSATGLVVGTGNSAALANALFRMIEIGSIERSRLGKCARLRIEKNYSIEIAAARFENLYRWVVSQSSKA